MLGDVIMPAKLDAANIKPKQKKGAETRHLRYSQQVFINYGATMMARQS